MMPARASPLLHKGLRDGRMDLAVGCPSAALGHHLSLADPPLYHNLLKDQSPFR